MEFLHLWQVILSKIVCQLTSQECFAIRFKCVTTNTEISCLLCSRHLKAGVLLLNTVLKKLAYSDTDSFDEIKSKS